MAKSGTRSLRAFAYMLTFVVEDTMCILWFLVSVQPWSLFTEGMILCLAGYACRAVTAVAALQSLRDGE